MASRVVAVNNLVTVSLSQNQFDALIDFTFNVGIGGFGKSTLLRELNTGNFEMCLPNFYDGRMEEIKGSLIKAMRKLAYLQMVLIS